KQFVRDHVRTGEKLTISEILRKIFVPSPPWRWALGGAAALAIVAVVAWPRADREEAMKLALASNAELGRLEMEVPGAEFGQYHKVMGTASGPKSASLLEAERIVVEHQRKGGANDPKWLQMDGVTSLLEGTGSSASKAVEDFERARAEGMNDPSV